MPLRESQCDVDPLLAFGRVVKDDEDVLVCHDSKSIASSLETMNHASRDLGTPSMGPDPGFSISS